MNTLLLEDIEGGEIALDIYQKLSNDKILFISDFIDDNLATDLVATLILKDAEFNPKIPKDEQVISLIINSEGGDIRSVFMIYDMINLLKSPVQTICVGSAMDETVVLLAAGNKGRRFATSNAIISPSHLLADKEIYSNLSDAHSLMIRFEQDNKRFLQILAKCTGKTLKEVSKDFERKKFFNPTQAFNYGIIDGIVTKGLF